MNNLQKIMTTRITEPLDRPSIVPAATASASAKWLRNHKQTNDGKNFEKIENEKVKN